MSLPADPVRLRRATARPGLAANAGAATAAVLFGASVVAVRVAVQEIPPLSLAVVRFGQAALLLVGALLLAAPARLRVQRGRLPLLVLLGAVLFTLFPVTFNAGLRWTEASRGALMLATMPLWSVWLARGVAGERLAGRQLAGVVVTVLGVALAFVEPRALHGGAEQQDDEFVADRAADRQGGQHSAAGGLGQAAGSTTAPGSSGRTAGWG